MKEKKLPLKHTEEQEKDAEIVSNEQPQSTIANESVVQKVDKIVEGESNKDSSVDNAVEHDKAISRRNKIIKRLCIALFILVTVGVLLFTAINDFSGGESASFALIMKTVGNNWLYLVLAFACFIGCILFRGLTLSVMMFSITKKPMLPLCVETAVIGKYYDYITPLGAGGQPFQILHLSRNKNVPKGVSGALPISEFAINMISFLVLTIVALILNACNVFGTNSIITDWTVGLAVLGLVLNCFTPAMMLLFLLWPKGGEAIVRFGISLGTKFKFIKRPQASYKKAVESMRRNAASIKMMCKSWVLILVSFVFALLSQFCLCSIAFHSLKVFGYDSGTGFINEWFQVVVICMILYSAVAFVPTPGNAGAADYSFHALFSACFTVAGFAFSAMITWRLLCFYSFLVAGLVQILISTIRKRHSRKNDLLKGETQYD